VISYALQQGNATVVLDDLAARRRARSLGLPLIGSVGVILRAKEHGLVPQVRPFLEKLRGGGGYVSENIIQQALKKADEL
jgi:predicted nucleic acid-binding protein